MANSTLTTSQHVAAMRALYDNASLVAGGRYFREVPHPGPAIFGPYTRPTRVERLSWWLITSAVHGIERFCNNEPVYRLRMAWNALRRGGF